MAARALAAQGVGRGDVVLLNLPRVQEWWLLSLALLRLGAVMSPGTTSLSSADLVIKGTFFLHITASTIESKKTFLGSPV